MSFYRYIRFKHIQMRIYSLFLLVWTKIWRGFPNIKGWGWVGGWEGGIWSLVIGICPVLQYSPAIGHKLYHSQSFHLLVTLCKPFAPLSGEFSGGFSHHSGAIQEIGGLAEVFLDLDDFPKPYSGSKHKSLLSLIPPGLGLNPKGWGRAQSLQTWLQVLLLLLLLTSWAQKIFI